MKKMDILRELVKENPEATNVELEELSKGKLSSRIISIYIKRLQENGEVMIVNEGGKRLIKQVDRPIAKSFKSQMLQSMLEVYLDDFESAALFEERIEIGKIMLRIIEKL